MTHNPQVDPRNWAEEICNKRNLSMIDDIYDDEFVDRTAPPGLPSGREGYKAYVAFLVTSYPDLRVTVDDLITDGDKIVMRWTIRGTHSGQAMRTTPTNQRVEYSGVSIYRLGSNGKVAELWAYADGFSVMSQLGVQPQREAVIPSKDEISEAVRQYT